MKTIYSSIILKSHNRYIFTCSLRQGNQQKNNFQTECRPQSQSCNVMPFISEVTYIYQGLSCVGWIRSDGIHQGGGLGVRYRWCSVAALMPFRFVAIPLMLNSPGDLYLICFLTRQLNLKGNVRNCSFTLARGFAHTGGKGN